MVSRKQRRVRDGVRMSAEILALYEKQKRAACDLREGGCGARPGESCLTPGGRVARRPHKPRRDRAMDEGYVVPT